MRFIEKFGLVLVIIGAVFMPTTEGARYLVVMAAFILGLILFYWPNQKD